MLGSIRYLFEQPWDFHESSNTKLPSRRVTKLNQINYKNKSNWLFCMKVKRIAYESFCDRQVTPYQNTCSRDFVSITEVFVNGILMKKSMSMKHVNENHTVSVQTMKHVMYHTPVTLPHNSSTEDWGNGCVSFRSDHHDELSQVEAGEEQSRTGPTFAKTRQQYLLASAVGMAKVVQGGCDRCDFGWSGWW